jgi:hypothetical protein
LASLHKVLKDETRQRILLTLNDRGNQSHTVLMSTLGITSTGKFLGEAEEIRVKELMK